MGKVASDECNIKLKREAVLQDRNQDQIKRNTLLESWHCVVGDVSHSIKQLDTR